MGYLEKQAIGLSTNSLHNSFEFYFGKRIDSSQDSDQVKPTPMIDKKEELKINRSRAMGGMITYVRAVLDAHEYGYEASESVWRELRRWHDEYKSAQDAYIDHLLEKTP